MSDSSPHLSVAVPATAPYRVVAELALPSFGAERAFVRAERQYVARQRAARPSWLAQVWRAAEHGPTAAAWDHYDLALQQYARQLDQAEAELRQGVMPLKLLVVSDSPVPTRHLRVSVTIHDGELHVAKQPPKRPAPVDRSEPINWAGLFGYRGFWRGKVRLQPHHITATLHGLGADHIAYVVDRPLYITHTDATRLTYQLDWTGMSAPLQGEVWVIPPGEL